MPGPTTCEVCGRLVPQPKRGYRLLHDECRSLHEDLQRMAKHLEQLAAGTHPANPTPERLQHLWFDLFAAAAAIPRQRDRLGRYVSTGISSEYEAERDARRRRKAL